MLLEIIRSFPLSVENGVIEVRNTATGSDLKMFQRAWEGAEIEVLRLEQKCEQKEAHRTLDAWMFNRLALNVLVDKLLIATEMRDPGDLLWAAIGWQLDVDPFSGDRRHHGDDAFRRNEPDGHS